MPTTKVLVLYISLASSVAIALAAIIFIIVDKTSYCRYDYPKPYTAVSRDDGKVVCLPGYVFVDGETTHYITCDNPPHWNWDQVPACVKVNEAVAWKCPVQSPEMELTGEILIFQSSPSVPVRVQGQIVGLKTSIIQVFDVTDTNKTCHITNELGSSENGSSMVIDGNMLRINEELTNPMKINETFQFFVRAIGSQHVQNQRVNQFDGVAVFAVEQNKKTIGVFSASSSISSGTHFTFDR